MLPFYSAAVANNGGSGYSKNPHKRTHFFSVQADFVLIHGIFLQNQPEDVLKVFLILFLEIIYCIDY